MTAEQVALTIAVWLVLSTVAALLWGAIMHRHRRWPR